jgi:hypothetical protein
VRRQACPPQPRRRRNAALDLRRVAGQESAVMPAQSKGNSRNSQLRTCHAGGRGYTKGEGRANPPGEPGSNSRFTTEGHRGSQRNSPKPAEDYLPQRAQRRTEKQPKTVNYEPATRAGVVTRKGRVGRTLRVSRDRTAPSPQRATESHRENPWGASPGNGSGRLFTPTMPAVPLCPSVALCGSSRLWLPATDAA